jgi:tetratricopeptide (TPR) repeat protein
MANAISHRAALAVLLVGLAGVAWAEKDGGLREKALKLNEITGTSAMEGQLRALVKDEAGAKKLLAIAGKMAEEKPQPFNYNAAFVLARAAHGLKDFDSAQRFYKICSEQAFKLQSANKLIQVYDGLIDLFYQNNKFDEAIKACQEFLELPAGGEDSPVQRIKPFVMEKMIQAMARKGKIDEALKLTNELIDADEGGFYFVQLKGWVQREAGQLEEAADTYLDAIERLKKNKNLEEKRRDGISDGLRYLLSGIYVDAKKIDKAAEQLQILLKRKPDNPTFNNDLGFIWADHDMNLDESEKLIRKAIEEDRKERKKDPELTPEEDKDNPAYLDSLGWVLFKKKDYKEAKKYLLEAVKEKEGQHIEILDHLADVHIALKEKDEAIKVWKKALEQKEEQLTKRDKTRRTEIEKKLKEADGK